MEKKTETGAAYEILGETENETAPEDTAAENELRIQNEKYKNIIRELTIMSDVFMRTVFRKVDCTEKVLQIIMKNKDIHIQEQVIQMDYKNLQGRSLELDCLAKDTRNILYNVEIENTNKRGKPKRARYHSGLIDMNSLEAGQDFEKLPESYVIFITENDILGKNQQIYHINRRIEETEDIFSDAEHIIYVNSKIQDDTDLGRLMHDFHCKKADEMYNEVLADRVRELKETEKGELEMCKELEELYAEAEQQGRAEGRTEGRVSSIRALMENIKCSMEQAMDMLGIAVESRETYRRMLEK